MSSASTRNNNCTKNNRLKVSRFLLGLSAASLMFLSACNFPRDNIAATAAYLYFQQTQVAESLATPPLNLVQPIQTLLPTQPFEEDRPTPQPIETIPPVPPTPVKVCELALEPGKQLYCTQSGDRLDAIARRFRVNASQIQGVEGLDPNAILPVNTPLGLPNPTFTTPFNQPALPDNAIIYGPDSASSDIVSYAQNAGGFLSQYRQYLYDGWHTGPEIVALVAVETSTNPRLLLSLVEYQSNWLFGHPANAADDLSPLNYEAVGVEGLYSELQVAARGLSRGYYGWREAPCKPSLWDKQTADIAPKLNVGSVAVQNLFAVFTTKAISIANFTDLTASSLFHAGMFG